MYEAEQREADMLFDLACLIKKVAEEMKRLANRCDEYANSYDALDDDYERLEEKYNKLYEENLHLAVELEKVKEVKGNG